MTVEIREAKYLRLKLGREDNSRQPVSFLLGAPFSLDRGAGVPGIDGFVGIARARVEESGTALLREFDEQVTSIAGPDQYQAAMSFLYDLLDARAATDVVQEAVLRARKPSAPPFDECNLIPDEWEITRAQHGLARVMQLAPHRFPGPIFTTNFDPMISLALENRGFKVNTVGIPLEGSISIPVKMRTSEIDVFHLHGYWRDSATLHRPQQLLAKRPQLQQSLQRHLDNVHLVVMAYSGWDDIFTTAIANCLSDPAFNGTVSWCFYEQDEARAVAQNQRLFEKFAAGIAQGKIAFFRGVDCHSFFDELGGDALEDVAAGVVESPMPGWQIVTRKTLETETPLRTAEALRFFDGALPTLRHAASPLIPRLSKAETLLSRLKGSLNGGCALQLVRAASGEGKSTTLLQAAVAAVSAGDWSALYCPASDAGLNAEILVQLDPAKNWLIVLDDAEEYLDDLWQAVGKLHAQGRSNIFFLLAARDTDWRLKGGESKPWSTRVNRLDDLTLSSLGEKDIGLIVDAWAAQGEDGLRALSGIGTRDARIRRFMDAIGAQSGQAEQGSFFGGLLDTRFGATGLVDHLMPLLEFLKGRSIEGGTGTLLDALLYIACCHATGMIGLNVRVLALLCGVPPYRVSGAVMAPLGRELGAAEIRGHARTRHKHVADAIMVAANRLGADLRAIWPQLIDATVRSAEDEKIGDTFSQIILAGSRLKRDLPQGLSADLRDEIAIAAAEAAVVAMPKWTGVISALAHALRSAGYSQEAFDLLKKKLPTLKNTVDKEMVVRGYFYEWSACAGNLGGRQGSVMDAWLAAISLSDLLPVELTFEQAKMSCAGLGSVFKRLAGDASGTYAKGRRAVIDLGWRAKPDQRATGILSGHQRELDAADIPKPADIDQAISWLTEAAFAAQEELQDPLLRGLKEGRLAFTRLRTLLLVQK
ncbi:SIR2 family protein [Sphingomonas sp. HITSZ_GF]|uniref:P-loop NTPase n=1 Tax=Sphingomonas sp. HITSZ_GF TaxID=3037247 RepID=UPI00240D1CED|nr:SIR2 family protein [Sphingomonas sp. HITSZ_GF]MDG2532805.1 SIR2 family protein [Sphingomonas sp. HITSZ_GF]